MEKSSQPAMAEPDESLDERLADIIKLLQKAPWGDVGSVLDVGAGEGQLAKYLAGLGKKVTCTGLHIESYVPDMAELHSRHDIRFIECDIEHMPFPDKSFDAVVLSHVLEHCADVGRALGHVRRVLRENGLLLVFVPPAEDTVCAGHVSVGWNIGQLMYVLALNGFDVRNGNFIEYGYNVCGFVRRSERALPALRFDGGDIAILAKEGFFPLAVGSGDAPGDSFDGSVKAVNWPDYTAYRIRARNPAKRFVLNAMELLPRRMRLRIGRLLARTGRALIRYSTANPDRLT